MEENTSVSRTTSINRKLANPNEKNSIILRLYFDNIKTTVSFPFPLNPENMVINQANRVTPIFTYGSSVYQNLGKGIKTINISGMTGYRLASSYAFESEGITNVLKETAMLSQTTIRTKTETIIDETNRRFNTTTREATTNETSEGKKSFLNLYAMIQLLKGESFYFAFEGLGMPVPDKYDLKNVKNVKAQLIIPDMAIVYDVMLQSDSFMRSKSEPHLYRYNLSFFITKESYWNEIEAKKLKPEESLFIVDGEIPWYDRWINALKNAYNKVAKKVKSLVNKLKKIGKSLGVDKAIGYIQSGLRYAAEAYKLLVFVAESTNKVLDSAVIIINSATNSIKSIRNCLQIINDTVRRIDSIIHSCNDFLNEINGLAPNRILYQSKVEMRGIKNNLIIQKDLLTKHQTYLNENSKIASTLQYFENFNYDKTLSSGDSIRDSLFGRNKLEITRDLKNQNSLSFPYPLKIENDIDGYGVASVRYASGLSPVNVSAYALNDYSKTNNLVKEFTDTTITFVDTFNNLGSKFQFVIDLVPNENEFSLDALKYKSIRKVKIRAGQTFTDLLEKYAKSEYEENNNLYRSIVSYFNNLEAPYVVAPFLDKSDGGDSLADYQLNYAGSYCSKNWPNDYMTQAEFSTKIISLNTNDLTNQYVNPNMYGFSYRSSLNVNGVSDSFIMKHEDILKYIDRTDVRFFNLILKNVNNNKLYVLYGIYENGPFYYYPSSPYFLKHSVTINKKLFDANKYLIVGIEKGSRYDVTDSTYFEVLSQYNLNDEIMQNYNQTDYYEGLSDYYYNITPDEMNRLKLYKVVQNIYNMYLGPYNLFGESQTYSSEYSRFLHSYRFDSSYEVFLAGDTNNENQFVFDLEVNGNSDKIIARKKYNVLTTNDYINFPMFSNEFLPFALSNSADDNIYKVDLDGSFDTKEKVVINGEQLLVDLPVIFGTANVKQAIVNRLNCPIGGLRRHNDYGFPNLLGAKNSFENMVLAKYYVVDQLKKDNRIKTIDKVVNAVDGDSLVSNAYITLVNDDKVTV